MEINSETIEGTCQQMCPRDEFLMREKEGLLHILEVTTMDDRGVNSKPRMRFKGDPAMAVKQFSRPAAGRADTDPANLRPAPVLRGTVTYLFENIVPRAHPAWWNIYQFVFDRLRAVRQDMVIQGIIGQDAICILEQVVRFHLYASYRLREATVDQYDPVINKQHLLECLKRLLYLYKVTPGPHIHREEFESIYLLDNLGDNHAMTHFLALDPEIRQDPKLRQCYAISQAYVLRNYTYALRLVWRLSCAMCLCAVNPHLDILRINFLQVLSAGYSVKNCRFPIAKLRELLHLTSTAETLTLCSLCGLTDLFDNPSTEFICFSRTAFSRPKEERPPTSLQVLDQLLSPEELPILLLCGGTANDSGIDLRSLRDALPGIDTSCKPDIQWRQQDVLIKGEFFEDSIESNELQDQNIQQKMQNSVPELTDSSRVGDYGCDPLNTMDVVGGETQRLNVQGQVGAWGQVQGQPPRGVQVTMSDAQQPPRGRGRGRGRRQ